MASDISGVLQSATTKTATFQSATYDLKTQTPKRGLVARFAISSFISAGTGGTVFTPSIEQSDDGSVWVDCASGVPITGTTSANTTQAPIFVRFYTNKRYVRAVMTLAPTSGSPSITYRADLVTTDA